MINSIPANKYCRKVFDGTHDTPKPSLAGMPLVTSKNILGGKLNLYDTYNISEKDYISIQKRSAVSQWDVLFSMIGSVGEVYLEKNEEIRYAIKNVGVFSCGDEYKAKWLYYYLQSPASKKFINNYLAGAVQKFLGLGILRDYPVFPFDETKAAAADILFLIDSKIELNNKINAELEELAKTIYDYWFVQFDFPDENGNPYKSSGGKMVWNDELKRDIPDGWQVKKLGELFLNRNESVTARTLEINEPYTPIDSIPIRKMSFGTYLSSKEAKTSLIRYKTNDILIGAMRVYFHRVCIAPFDGITRTTTMILTPILRENYPYLYQICNDKRTIAAASNMSNGTQQPYINWNNSFENYLIPYPGNDAIIKKYSDISAPCISEVVNNEKENNELSIIRDWLLPMLMNGQVTVQD